MSAKNTGKMVEGAKWDSDKVRLDLFAPELFLGISEILTLGAAKYEPHNWKKGILFSRVYAALQRHLQAFWMGEEMDDETKKPHLWHAGCCLMFLCYYTEYPEFEQFDDRAFKKKGVHQ